MGARSILVSLPTTRFARTVLFVGVVAAALAGPAGAADYAAVRRARPDGRTVSVTELTLVKDAFTLRFGPGTFHLLAAVDERTFGAVFLGHGSWTLTPATEIDRRYLVGLVRGNPEIASLSDEFDSLVLFFLDGTLEAMVAGGAIATGPVDARAAAVYDAHLAAQRNQWRLNVHQRMYRSLLQGGEPFFAFAGGGTLQPALVAVDPEGLHDGEESVLYLDPRRANLVYSSHLREEVAAGRGAACSRPERFDALHYVIDTRVRKDTSLEASTTLRFKVLAPGLRFVPLELLPALRIREAARIAPPGEAVTLEWIQEPAGEDAAAAVVFPQPLVVGEEVTLRIAYAGDEILDDAGDGNFRVMARTSWYPNLGYGDFATYELAFHVPAKQQVVSVGRLVDAAQGAGEAISNWRADVPIPVAGFNYGIFRLLEETEKNTQAKLQVYTNPGTPDVIEELNRDLAEGSASIHPMDAIAIGQSMEGYVPGTISSGPSRIDLDTEALARAALADAVNSVQVYSQAFGKLPFERIAITQQSAGAEGQSWPTLIFLPYLGALGSTMRAELGLLPMSGFLDQVGLHEMAHQWWGNQVGWASYRDQWISEGFAEFSAALALQTLHGRAAYDAFWESARRKITTKEQGATIRNHEAGPLTLGYRLNTERSPVAYQALAYSKGGYVLHMLRMMMRDDKDPEPDGRFFAMLRDFVATHTGRAATTEDFKRTVEKHMVPELNATRDGKIDWFFDQWVYGTEIPTYTAKVEIDKAEGGKWHLHGSVSQSGVSDGFLTLLPLYLEFDKGRFLALAKSPFRGTMTHPVDVTIALPDKPKRVRVNLQHEVLALDEP